MMKCAETPCFGFRRANRAAVAEARKVQIERCSQTRRSIAHSARLANAKDVPLSRVLWAWLFIYLILFSFFIVSLAENNNESVAKALAAADVARRICYNRQT